MKAVERSTRLYRALLIVYPLEYRREYGAHMTQLFSDVCRDAYRERGISGIVRWWLSALLDLIVISLQQHRTWSNFMWKNALIRTSGLLLAIGGGVLALSSVVQLDLGAGTPLGMIRLPIWLTVPAFVCIAFGLLGLALRSAAPDERAGRIALYVAGSGALAISLGFGFATLHSLFWLMGMVGIVASGIGVLAFWFLHLQAPIPLPARVVMLAAGVLPLVLMAAVLIGGDGALAPIPAFALLLLMGLDWIMVGIGMQSRETTPAGSAV